MSVSEPSDTQEWLNRPKDVGPLFGWLHSSILIDPEDGTNRCSEMSAYKHNTPGNNPPKKTRFKYTKALPSGEYKVVQI